MIEQFQNRAVVSVTEMAAMVNLSRERFYQLLGTTFPYPVYDTKSHRPFYTAELQEVCRIVRETHCGIDGRPVLFYRRRAAAQRPSKPTRPSKAPPKEISEVQYPEILAAVRALGLAVTGEQITAAIQAAYPNGTGGVEQGQIIRAVFLRIKRQNHGDTVA